MPVDYFPSVRRPGKNSGQPTVEIASATVSQIQSELGTPPDQTDVAYDSILHGNGSKLGRDNSGKEVLDDIRPFIVAGGVTIKGKEIISCIQNGFLVPAFEETLKIFLFQLIERILKSGFQAIRLLSLERNADQGGCHNQGKHCLS